MVDVFQVMADVTRANAAVLASGIWSALITTIMGLTVAIPTLMAYYYIVLKFRGFHIEAVEHSYRALETCRRLGVVQGPTTKRGAQLNAVYDESPAMH